MEKQPPTQASPNASWAVQVAKVAGIPIRIHVTFVILLIGLGWIEYAAGRNALDQIAFLVGLFGCVLLHELGHALVARSNGIRTSDITLYPIGGIARVESMGKPNQEFWIALAGPLVNVAIAGIIWGYLVATGSGPAPRIPALREDLSYIQELFFANVVLAAFNLLPAFPMDGGRILRAILAQRMGNAQATAIAARVGQLFAVLFGLAGLVIGNLMLLFIAFFIFMAASGENVVTQTQAVTTGHRVREAMITRFEKLSHGQVLADAVDALLSTHQQDFPVMLGEQVLGVLPRDQLFLGLAREGRNTYVSEVMVRDIDRVSPEADLSEAIQHFGRSRLPLFVFDSDKLVGMLTPENLGEFIVVQQSLARAVHRA